MMLRAVCAHVEVYEKTLTSEADLFQVVSKSTIKMSNQINQKLPVLAPSVMDSECILILEICK